ncbi:pyridoxamine 5'-phosphate oxidase family protein [Methylobacterium sp. E-066]|uniref:pyridoxamine 5'-phosphate oxidase family protein n=1 Tax=Methylobacterium sp. E-066 TaxID=2836584 RepID=UPI001FB8BBC6|nr:pyridoxamine 5'-phosphate oxidase family protein [Methylobacterium sp. E-066]MCJ2144697.1 pyridoxamine 5'-phosphate oxidase family protein [Methylobacterium sp. E-066]
MANYNIRAIFMLNEAIRSSIGNSVLCWLATVDSAGLPNVTPKEIFKDYGDNHIVIADIASSNSTRNISNHPSVCVSFIDVFRQCGFKIDGTASLVTPDKNDFPVVGAELLRMTGDIYPIRNIILIAIDRVSPIWAPSYKLLPDQTEAQRMQQAFDTYGVIPVDR